MVSFSDLFSAGRRGFRDHQYGSGSWNFRENLMPRTNVAEDMNASIPSKKVTKTALRLKALIESAVPCELKESQITRPHSQIITDDVVELAKKAAPKEDAGCIVYALCVCIRWFTQQANVEMYDADLNQLRSEACQVISKRIIEGMMENDQQDYLFEEILLKRYSIIRNGEESIPANVIERAIDLHATRIIGSSGFQKCIMYLWRGWIVQDLEDPRKFSPYKETANKSFWVHADHERIRAPRYQNAFQVMISVLFLILYTVAINTVNPTGDIDIEEAILYILTASFLAEEGTKLWKVGRFYLSFWNTFNLTLYSLLTVSFVLRCIALTHSVHSMDRDKWNILSYNFLAFVAPMVWSRMLLYLDSLRFFGAMLVVLKVMMMESIIFFALLVVVVLGFLQGFVGLAGASEGAEYRDYTKFVLSSMAKAVLQSPEFDGFDNYGHPFGLILYYIFTFVVMVILLNILIALYNQAYADVTENAIDEYLALFAQKTLRFVRAPDENVFLPPLNLIELFFLIIPFEPWLPRAKYAKLNDYVMAVVYSPFLGMIALLESHEARGIMRNRAKGESDDNRDEEWEELTGELDAEGDDGWGDLVKHTVADVETDSTVVEIKLLRQEVKELKAIIMGMASKEKPAEIEGGERSEKKKRRDSSSSSSSDSS